MLYDPKWEAPVKANPFELSTLIAWLKTKEPDEMYCYTEAGSCLLSKYFHENGFPKFHCGPTMGHWYRNVGDGRLPKHFNSIARGNGAPRDWTFGKALKRANRFARS
jgi:hypothetical protein